MLYAVLGTRQFVRCLLLEEISPMQVVFTMAFEMVLGLVGIVSLTGMGISMGLPTRA